MLAHPFALHNKKSIKNKKERGCADIYSCKEYVELRKNELSKDISTYKRNPHLVVIQIGDDTASNSYIKGKKRDCEEVGIKLTHCHIRDYKKISQKVLERTVNEFNNNKNVDGIIIQLPVPEMYDIEKLQQYINPGKDVDGFRRDSLFNPCTPKGIIDWMKFNNIDLIGKKVTVLGRSKIVGKPLVNMLIDEGATVTCCNSHTKNITTATYYSNIVISAIGKPRFLKRQYFNSNTCDLVIDVGINRDCKGMLCGDVDYNDVSSYLRNAYITPVPGGVGLLTRLSLLENTVNAYKRSRND